MTTTTAKERAEKAADDFCNAVNEMSFDSKAFAEQVRRNHRTVQQNVGGVLLVLLSQWAEDGATKNFDLRNQAVCEFADKVEPFNPQRFPFI
jgi:hypothetical protein